MTRPDTGRTLQLAVVQMSMAADVHENVGRAGELVSRAAADGAQLVLLPELFASRYFPVDPEFDAAELAAPPEQSEPVQAMRLLARTHGLVLPVSYYERDPADGALYNSVLVWGPDGGELGRYRKSHIPDGEGYEEKRFFAPGMTGFSAIDTPFGRIGVAICWDQWFPECARALALDGAQLLLYPTAIGSEPGRPELDTRDPWRRVMIGHAVANTIPVAAANRVGCRASSASTARASSATATARRSPASTGTSPASRASRSTWAAGAMSANSWAYSVIADPTSTVA